MEKVANLDKNKIKLIAFDVDGTIAEHKQPLEQENRRVLENLSKRYKLLIVGSRRVVNIDLQLKFPIDVLGNYGMEYGEYNYQTKKVDLIYSHSQPCNEEEITKKINSCREKYGFKDFKGENVRFHPSGCITFPLIGTEVELSTKLQFDPDKKKRRSIYDQISNIFSEYNVFLGGTTSFDIVPKPFDKYYALDKYCSERGYSHDQVVFVGDDYGQGGNDHSVFVSDFNTLKIDHYTNLKEVTKILID